MAQASTHKKRIDALDGIRTIAVFLVIAFHTSSPRMAAGYLGVDIFFVLSGFLITHSLVSDLNRYGRIRYRRFWSRRIARLMPAALLTVVVVLIWSWCQGHYVRSQTGKDSWFTIFYLANWHFMGAGSYFESDGTVSPLLHMWSLAVEEQFYLFWPLVIGLFVRIFAAGNSTSSPGRTRKLLLSVSTTVITFSLILIAVLSDGSTDRAYMGTDTKAFEPMIGALGAIISTSETARGVFARFSRPVIWCGGILMCLLFIVLDGPSDFYFYGGAGIFSMSALVLILGVRFGLENAEAKILAWPPISYLGRISYGLYLWHWPWAIWLLTPTKGFEPARALLVVILTILTASASYHLLEMPIREGTISKFLTETKTIVFGVTAMLIVALFAGATGGTPISKSIFNILYGSSLDDKTIMVVGDSVPLRLMPSLTKQASERGYSVVSAARGACSPMGLDLIYEPSNPSHSDCPAILPTQEETRESYRPGHILWWSRYEIIDRYQGDKILSPDTEQFWVAQDQDFRASVDRLTRDGSTLTVVLTERPGLGTLDRPESELKAPIIKYMINHDEYRQRFNEIVRAVSRDNDRVFVVDGDTMFCGSEPTGRSDSLCDDSVDGKFIRYDGSHIDMEPFGDLISERLLDRFDDSTARRR